MLFWRRILPALIVGAGIGLVAPAAIADDDAVILESCKADLELSDKGCSCLLDKIHDELTVDQQAFLVASIGEDRSAVQTAMTKLSGEEMMEMATFMTVTPSECKNG